MNGKALSCRFRFPDYFKLNALPDGIKLLSGNLLGLEKSMCSWQCEVEIDPSKMKQCGAKNVAVILQASLNNQSLVQLKKLADNSGLFIPPDWLLTLNFELKDSIAQKWLISGLFSGNRKVHPDGLIVMNENFVPSVIDQLYQEGRIPGQNIHVVAHCNWPISSNEHPGVHYIGFHTGDILKSFMSGIRKFTGDTTPVVELLPRMFKSGEAPLR